MTKQKVTLGADPEIFLQDAGEALIAVCGKVGGNKQFPMPLFELGDGYAVQEDNVAVEFNIPPANTEEDFVEHIQKATNYLQDQLSNIGLYFNKSSAAYYPPEQLLDPQAQEFGCEPDFDAWNFGKTNPKPKADDPTLRSAGGHVHIGLKFKDKQEAINLIKLLDLHLAVPSVIQDDGLLRKSLYGKRGAFRYKSFGIEYRTLSNYWIFDKRYTSWVWKATNNAIEDWENNVSIDNENDMIAQAVNHNNIEAANHLISKYNLIMA